MATVILPSAPPATVFTKINTSLSGVISAEQDSNYVVDAGASNALTVTLVDNSGANVALAAGLRLTVKTANTLQAGANTLALNGGATKSIKSQSLTNLKTAYVAGAILPLVYDGTQWQLLGIGS